MAKDVNVAAAVIIRGNQFLAGKRESGRLGENAWELPGGKIKAGEDPREALKRELKEELGVEVAVGERVTTTIDHEYPWANVHMQVFYARITSGDLVKNAHSELKWGTVADLYDLDWLPAAYPALDALKEVDLTQVTTLTTAPYQHTVEYYETDRMQITHHSNYVRWMEEARVRFLDNIGWDFRELESRGITSPVTEVNCQYKRATDFGDVVTIKVTVAHLSKAKLTLRYRMERDGDLVCIGKSSHCFLNPEGKLMRLDKDMPELYATLSQYVEK